MTDRGPDDPLELRARRSELPPDAAWPPAVLTVLGWYLLVLAGLAWLAYGPLAPPPHEPWDEWAEGWAGLDPTVAALASKVVLPVLGIGLVVSLVLCRVASREGPASAWAGIWRGTWTFLLGPPCAAVLYPLALLVTTGWRLGR